MMQRVMPELMGMRSIFVFNDEAHHCYREKPGQNEEGKLTSEDSREANKNREAARLWISGLEAVQRKLGIRRVIDLSATPFFLRGSGYREGTLFPWTMCDFSLMDAIECGIVKLPRVPSPTIFPARRSRCTANSGNTSAATCPRKAEASPARSIRSASRSSCRPRFRRYTALRGDLPPLAAGRHRGAALLHRGLQQHRNLQARL